MTRPKTLAEKTATRYKNRPTLAELRAACEDAYDGGNGAMTVLELAELFNVERQQIYRWLGKK